MMSSSIRSCGSGSNTFQMRVHISIPDGWLTALMTDVAEQSASAACICLIS
jgi:hypothetical protein